MFQNSLHLPTVLREPGSSSLDQGETVGMTHLVGEGKYVAHFFKGTVWIAECPQRKGLVAQAGHTRVIASIERIQRVMLLAIIQRCSLFRMSANRDKLSFPI